MKWKFQFNASECNTYYTGCYGVHNVQGNVCMVTMNQTKARCVILLAYDYFTIERLVTHFWIKIYIKI